MLFNTTLHNILKYNNFIGEKDIVRKIKTKKAVKKEDKRRQFAIPFICYLLKSSGSVIESRTKHASCRTKFNIW